MGTLKKYPLLLLFVVFLFATSIADLIASNRDFSEMENRYLAKKPKMTLSSLVAKKDSDKFTRKYETYINDQFVGRDSWINLKSVSESALGKIENNGIIYGKDHNLFEYYTALDERRLQMNIEILGRFFDAYKAQTPMTAAIIPNSYELLSGDLPAGLHNVAQRERIAEIYSSLPANIGKLDLFPAMEQAKAAGQAYYRTDHHWTMLGAYHGYRAFVESRGLKSVALSALEPLEHRVEGFYGSYYNKCKLFSAVPDEIVWYDIPFTSMTINGQEKSSLNDPEKWKSHDKHAAFLWGNNGVTVIRAENNLNHRDGETSRVLLIKDSYGNPMAPLLTYSYDEVWVVDLRELPMTTKFSDLMAQNFDDVLVLYNFMNFVSDSNFTFLNR